jgi:hypothetical protein
MDIIKLNIRYIYEQIFFCLQQDKKSILVIIYFDTSLIEQCHITTNVSQKTEKGMSDEWVSFYTLASAVLAQSCPGGTRQKLKRLSCYVFGLLDRWACSYHPTCRSWPEAHYWAFFNGAHY